MNVLKKIYYSFPFQLLLLQLKSYQLMLLLWGLFVVIVSGKFDDLMGLQYLFIDPEYMGEVNVLSFFLVGIAFSAFCIVWNLSLYILTSYRFPFLATLGRPFYKYCINNATLPFLFLIFYCVSIVRFQQSYEYRSFGDAVLLSISFLAGVLLFLLLAALYFNAFNKDLRKFTKYRSTAPDTFTSFLERRKIEHRYFNYKKYLQPDVRYYLNEKLRLKYVRSVDHYASSTLLKVFRQNHKNAISFFFILIVVLLFLGLMIEQPAFRIPTGATTFLFGAIIISIVGAISFWFRSWSLTAFIGAAIFINYFYAWDSFRRPHAAFGLDYSQEVVYDLPMIEKLASSDTIQKDRETMLSVLENWKAKNQKGDSLPKLVLMTTSGGGLKSAAWTLTALQYLDKETKGTFSEQLHLITGSSGGMFGGAYYRDLLWQKEAGKSVNLYDEKHLVAVSKDLQSTTAYGMVVNDIFIPWLDYEYQGMTYRKDRGYIFEKALNENTHNVFNKPISAYKKTVLESKIPALVISPVILNDRRKLTISSVPMSYLSKPSLGDIKHEVEVDGVELLRLFPSEGNDIKMSSALRLNATYPYILPSVNLPTKPKIEVLDAGYRDNIGMENSFRFLSNFSDWIKENTSGVVLVQVRSKNKYDEIEDKSGRTMVTKLIEPVASSMHLEQMQEYGFNNELSHLKLIFGDDFLKLVPLIYQPSKANKKASMSFHLTKRERLDIEASIYTDRNQKMVTIIKELINHE